MIGDCIIHGCENRASLDVQIIKICYTHGWEIGKAYRVRVLAEERVARRKAYRRRCEQYQKVQAEQLERGPSVVYYALIGDYIKIGTTTRLHARLAQLRADRLLAFEPGDRELEQQRHVEFRAERIDLRRENFRPSIRLNSHIEQLHEEHALPLWATLPRTTEITTTRLEETDV